MADIGLYNSFLKCLIGGDVYDFSRVNLDTNRLVKLEFRDNTIVDIETDMTWDDVFDRLIMRVYEEDRDRIREYCALERVKKFAVNEPVEFTYRSSYNREDGSYFHVRLRFLVTIEDGVKYVTACCKDITTELENQKRILSMKEEIKREKEANAVHQEVITSLCTDYENVYDFNLEQSTVTPIRLNKMMRDFFGERGKNWDINTMVDSYVKALVVDEDKATFKSIFEPENLGVIMRDRDVYVYDYRTIVDGKLVYNQAKITKSNIGNMSHIIGAFYDVTQEVMEKLEATERLNKALIDARKANKAKSVFLSNMSHDIRTPMNAILGYAAMARASKDDVKRADCLEKIGTAGEHLLSLINDILDMSRIESGKLNYEPIPSNIKDEASDLADMMRNEANKKNIELVCDFDVKNEFAFYDPLRLRQIELNLLSNAVKYTQNGGRVYFGIKDYECESGEEAVYEITVKDNGIGMSEEFQKTVFEVFARERETGLGTVQGTGLGLAITKSIVETMGGTITLESKQGVGSEFTVRFTVPIAEKVVRAAFEEVREGEFSGMKVLVVEDNELNLEIISEVLKNLEIEVECAMNGEEAVRRVSEVDGEYYDIVFMDIQMPVMNGHSATMAIRSIDDKSIKKLPVIAMTAEAFEEDRVRALKSGMNGHIAKPIEMKKLVSVLREYRK